MTKEEIIDKIEPIAREVFAQPDLVVKDDLSAATLSTWTSLSFTHFLTEIESVFEFKFKMMEILKMRDMGGIIAMIEKHVNA